MSNMRNVADSLNLLASFCEIRDVGEISQEKIRNMLGVQQVDVCVLFGGNNLAGADIFAETIRKQVARTSIIAGGIGHATEALKRNCKYYFDIQTDLDIESEIINHYLKVRYRLQADYLEKESTNAGSNITNLITLVDVLGIECESILMIQDAPIQRRMNAVVRKYKTDWKIINFAAYQSLFSVIDNQLCRTNNELCLWGMGDYVSILLGEIDRLRDDEKGYGPCGKNYIVHVDIPDEIEKAYRIVKEYYCVSGRREDIRFKGKM